MVDRIQICCQFQLAPLHSGSITDLTSVLSGKGLPLVHSSSQPEPFLELKHYQNTQRIPQKVLKLSWKFDECAFLLNLSHLCHW